MQAAVRVHQWRGVAAVTLVSGELEATFVPERNMLGASLQLRGEEFVALPGGLGAYSRLHTTGLPLVAPWANRLGATSYRSGSVGVDLRGLDLHTDGAGLPIHGTMTAREAWDVSALSARGRVARLRASFDYTRPDLLAAFPFPHRLETTIDVDGTSLSISTTVRPTADRPVPISFGYHPYLRLPHGRRSTWRLILPRRVALLLDEHGIPTGGRLEAPAEAEAVGGRTFDDLFALPRAPVLALEGGGRRLEVSFGSGFRFGQVYAPPGAAFVCLEPMTAPTNALVSGDCPVVNPGESFTARFRVQPGRTALEKE
jgi:galactose mutarotase-like enzyme